MPSTGPNSSALTVRPFITALMVWHTVSTASEYAGYSDRTILDALRDGSLRGNQRVKNGRWRIHRDDLDVWLRGAA